MNTLAKKHKLTFRDNEDSNAKYLLSKIQRYVESLGGKILKTEKGMRVVSATNPEKDLIVNRKVFNIDEHIPKIFPKPEPNIGELKNKPGRTTVIEEVPSKSDRMNTFSQRINDIIQQFK